MSIATKESANASDDAGKSSFKLWQSGEREQALSNLINECEQNADCGRDWSWLVTSWQMILAISDEAVLSFLRKFPSGLAHWHYSNALILYRTLGDCNISCSALQTALFATSTLGEDLLGTLVEDDWYDPDLGECFTYAISARDLWSNTKGALAWLEAGFVRYYKLIGEEQLSRDAKNKVQHKLWTDDFQIGLSHLRSFDYKKAKKSLLTSLRSARKFGLTSWEFEITVTAMMLVGQDALPQLTETLLEQLSYIKNLETSEPQRSMRAYKRLGATVSQLNSPTVAHLCYQGSLQILRDQLKNGNLEITMFEQAELLQSAAAARTIVSVPEAVALYKETLALRARYLGDVHPDQYDLLFEIYKCLLYLKESEAETDAVIDRLVALDPGSELILRECAKLEPALDYATDPARSVFKDSEELEDIARMQAMEHIRIRAAAKPKF